MIEAAAPSTEPSRGERLPSSVRARIGLSFYAFILIGAIDAAVGVLLPGLRAYYGIDKSDVSFLFASGTLGYLISAFTSGMLVEKLGLRTFMMFGPALIVISGVINSFAPPFVALMAGFLFSGFGIGLVDAGLNSYIAGLPNNTAPLNFLHAFYGVGALLGPLVATAILAYALRWNTIYYLWISMAILLVVGFALAFRGYKNPVYPTEQLAGKKQANVLMATLRLRVVWLAAFFLLIYVGIEVSLAGWGFSFLTEERHQPETLSGFAVSGYWLGLTIGRLVLGKVGEWIGNRRLIELCLGGVMASLLVIWLLPFGATMAVGLWAMGFSLAPVFPTTIALMSDLVPARVLPSAIGFLASFGSMGAALLPSIAGVLAQGFGLWVLMPYLLVLTVLLLGLWVILQRHQD